MNEEKVADSILNMVNDLSFDHELFAKQICNSHRTLQQSYFRSIIAVIRYMAQNGYDQRNQASHDTAKIIVESGALDNIFLPFI